MIIAFWEVSCAAVFAQTGQLTIRWDPNSEADMHRYRLQRSVNSLNDFQDFQEPIHPAVSVIDNAVVPGNLYAYRVAAIDSGGNQSPWSAIASAGLPKIDLALASISNQSDTTLAKTSFLIDPDDDVNTLLVEISLENNATVTLENSSIRISPSPANYHGPASFRIRATDGDGFEDIQDVAFTFVEKSTGSAPISVNIPDQTFAEDLSVTIKLDDHVSAGNFTPAELFWSFSGGVNLRYTFDAENRSLTVQSQLPDWFGQDAISATVTAPDQVAASASFMVTITPVNDPPQLNLQELFVGSASDNHFDLKLYADDVDHDVRELSWEFTGFSQFVFSWIDPAAKIIAITPIGSAQMETGTFRVSDPDAAADARQVTIFYTENNTPPHLLFNAPLVIAEDSSITLNLTNFVVDSTNAPGELAWEIIPGANLNAQFDATISLLRIQPLPDFAGESNLTFTVRDPLNAADTQTATVRVLDRNGLRNLRIEQDGPKATLRFDTENPSTAELRFWRTSYEVKTLLQPELQKQHALTMSGLLPGSTYFYQLKITSENTPLLSFSDSLKTANFGDAGLPEAAQKLIVYPNPVKPSQGHNELIFLNLPEETRSISLYTLVGEKVFEEERRNAAQTEQHIDMLGNTAKIPSGIYVYMLRGENARVIKQGRIVVIR